MRTRVKLSLLLAVWLCGACGEGSLPGKPELPASVSPGWTLKSYNPAAPPPGLPDGPAPQCWKADYAGPGKVEAWVCGYRASGSAFNAEQRARAEADTVKFQEGNYLIVVNWHGGSRAEVTALIRGLQKTLQVK
jgi:hypothetical protein